MQRREPPTFLYPVSELIGDVRGTASSGKAVLPATALRNPRLNRRAEPLIASIVISSHCPHPSWPLQNHGPASQPSHPAVTLPILSQGCTLGKAFARRDCPFRGEVRKRPATLMSPRAKRSAAEGVWPLRARFRSVAGFLHCACLQQPPVKMTGPGSESSVGANNDSPLPQAGGGPQRFGGRPPAS